MQQSEPTISNVLASQPSHYQRKTKNKSFLPSDKHTIFALNNFDKADKDRQLVRTNLKYLVKKKGISIRYFFQLLHAGEFFLSREAFLENAENMTMSRKVGLKVVVVSTFARVLCVPTWLLFSEHIERDWSQHKEDNQKTWMNIIRPEGFK